MPDAMEVLQAEAIVAELNDPARSWFGQFTAERKWLPSWTPEDLANLKVAVVPLTIESETKAGRDREQMTYGVGIDFQKKVDTAPAATNAEMDALTKLVQDVHDFYRLGRRLATLDSCKVMDAERTDIYLEDPLYGGSIWETYVLLRVLVFR